MRTVARTFTMTGVDHRIFWSLIFLLFASVIVYIYGISMSIVNVVLREEFEHRIADVGSKVATLESEYLQKKEAIDLLTAEASGFTLVPGKEYVTRGSLTLQTRQ